jgi:hypothetical protein
MTTSIIVYQNPAQQAFWELMMSGDMIPLAAGFIAIFAFAVAWSSLYDKMCRKIGRKSAQPIGWLGVPLAVGFGYGIWKLLAL